MVEKELGEPTLKKPKKHISLAKKLIDCFSLTWVIKLTGRNVG